LLLAAALVPELGTLLEVLAVLVVVEMKQV
jgi:hypothetical protein